MCQVIGEWFGLDLTGEILHFLHKFTQPSLLNGHTCTPIWELCVIFGMIITERAALQARNFIKKTRTLVSYFSIFKIISYLLLHLLSLQSSQNVWRSYQDLIVRGESQWGNWGMGLAGHALLHRLVSELGRLKTPAPHILVGSDSQYFLRVFSMACLQVESSRQSWTHTPK